MRVVLKMSLVFIALIPWAVAIIGVTACADTYPAGRLCIKLDMSGCDDRCQCTEYTHSEIEIRDADGNVWAHSDFGLGSSIQNPVCFNDLPSEKGLKISIDIACDGQKVHNNVGDYCSKSFAAMANTSLSKEEGALITVTLNCI